MRFDLPVGRSFEEQAAAIRARGFTALAHEQWASITLTGSRQWGLVSAGHDPVRFRTFATACLRVRETERALLAGVGL